MTDTEKELREAARALRVARERLGLIQAKNLPGDEEGRMRLVEEAAIAEAKIEIAEARLSKAKSKFVAENTP